MSYGDKEKIRNYWRQYRAANKEKCRETLKRWRAANPEKVKQANWRQRINQANWRKQNPEKQKERSQKYFQENREKILKRRRKWIEANKEKQRIYVRRAHRKISITKKLLLLSQLPGAIQDTLNKLKNQTNEHEQQRRGTHTESGALHPPLFGTLPEGEGMLDQSRQDTGGSSGQGAGLHEADGGTLPAIPAEVSQPDAGLGTGCAA